MASADQTALASDFYWAYDVCSDDTPDGKIYGLALSELTSFLTAYANTLSRFGNAETDLWQTTAPQLQKWRTEVQQKTADEKITATEGSLTFG